MELTKFNSQWNPIDVLNDLQSDLTRAFGSRTAYDGLIRGFEPQMEVREEDNHYVVHADLPGLSRENIELTVEGNHLTLKGERKQQTERKEKGYHYSERGYGRFTRSFEFPADIDAAKIKASFKDGVLEIVLPKAESSKLKQIKID